MTFMANSNLILQMPRPLQRGASTIILSKDINEYAFMCGSNFYGTVVSTYFSMTQLLSHTIAHFTGPSFMLKAN